MCHSEQKDLLGVRKTWIQDSRLACTDFVTPGLCYFSNSLRLGAPR